MRMAKNKKYLDIKSSPISTREKTYDREGELDQQSIFEATTRKKILH